MFIIYTFASFHSFENFESGHQSLSFVSNWKKFKQNKVDKSIQVDSIMNEQENKDDSPYFDILSNILKERHPVEGRQRVILISTGSFCPIHKGHLKLLDIAASFLSKEHKIDTLLGIISPKSDLFVSLKYGPSRYDLKIVVKCQDLLVKNTIYKNQKIKKYCIS